MNDGTQQQRSEILLKCQSVEKKFGALVAVNKLSFEVREGQVLGIGGPNGAGKTVLFDAISGVNTCTSGQIEFDGNRIDHRKSDDICHLGLSRTFQLNAGFDTLTVEENIRTTRYFGYANRRIPGISFDRDTHEKVAEVMEMVGLSDFADTQVRNLPVYQRKLLMIGAALSTEPKLLMLDEPVGGLIPAEIEKVMELVQGIAKKNITIILIEHVMRFLMQLSDSVMIMHRGEKLFEGLPNEILNDEKVVEVYLGETAAKSLRNASAS